MAPFIWFLIRQITIGFAIGAAAGAAFLALVSPIPDLSVFDLGWFLIVYAFGANFALGYLATGPL